jgi:hypothetical protein
MLSNQARRSQFSIDPFSRLFEHALSHLVF